MITKSYDDVILSHYEKEALSHGLDASSTMPDKIVRQRETDLILRFLSLALKRRREMLPAGQSLQIADAGCGNGYTLDVMARAVPDARFVGFEFTPALRNLAAKRFPDPSNTRIIPADLRQMGSSWDASFDVIVCQRVLINILDAEDQAKARGELTRMLKKGGFLISIECFETAWKNLNDARAEFALPAIPPRHHNLYLSDDFFARESALTPVTGPRLDPSLPEDFLPHNFLSSHYFVARVLHPIALGALPFAQNSHFVMFLSQAMKTPVGNYSPIQAFAFERVR